ncbi:MAG: WD40 repeat domain-containing protein [Planctomycetota bacterium]|jgi:hypothetical protein
MAKTLPVKVIGTAATPNIYVSMAQAKGWLYCCSGKDEEITIWDKATGRYVAAIPTDDAIAMRHLQADGRYLYSASLFGNLTKFTHTGRVKGTISAPSVSLTSDAAHLYAVTNDQKLTVIAKADLKVKARRPVGQWGGYGPGVCCDRDRVYVAAPKGDIHVYAKKGFKLVAHTDKGPVTRRAIVGGDHLYLACGDNRFRVYDKRTLERIAVLREEGAIRAVTTDQTYLYSVGFSSTMVVRDKLTGQERLVLENCRDCIAIVIDAESIYLATGDSDVLVVPRPAIDAEVAPSGKPPTILKADWKY